MKITTTRSESGLSAAVFLSTGQLLSLSPLYKSREFVSSGLSKTASMVIDVLARNELDGLRSVVDWAEGLNSEASESLASIGALTAEGAALFEAAIHRPSFILAQGLAYKKHLDEMDVPGPKTPAYLIKAPSSVTGHRCPIVLPGDHPDMVDWEGEFCAVVGREFHNISPEQVLENLAGYTIINDVSARDWTAAALNKDQSQMQAVLTWGDNLLGKQFPTFTPLGPVMVTSDEIENPNALELTTTVNGELMQHTNTSDLLFSVEDMIAHFSKWYRFLPGDVISTGSPSGVGYGRDPKVFLKPGDIVEVTVEGVGTLSNPVTSAF